MEITNIYIAVESPDGTLSLRADMNTDLTYSELYIWRETGDHILGESFLLNQLYPAAVVVCDAREEFEFSRELLEEWGFKEDEACSLVDLFDKAKEYGIIREERRNFEFSSS